MATVRCNGCGEVSDHEDVHCRCADMQVKTISLPLDIADRFERKQETSNDMGELRQRLRERHPDMIF